MAVIRRDPENKYSEIGYFSEGYCVVRQDNNYGYIDTEGNEVFGGFIYKKAKDFSEGFAAVKQKFW